jgi:hypothetical protein
MILTLEREGEFETKGMVETQTKCGPLGLQKYSYAVKIEATDESLSPEGFIIENGRVHNYFITRYASGKGFAAVSCEEMARRAAMEIGKQLVKERISVTAVICTIKGSNNARLTAHWRTL